MAKKIDQFIVEFYDNLGASYTPGDQEGVIVIVENKRKKYGCRLNSDGDYEAFLYSPKDSDFYTGKLLKEVTERQAELFLEEYTEDGRPLSRFILRFPKAPDEQVFEVGEEIIIYIGSPDSSE